MRHEEIEANVKLWKQIGRWYIVVVEDRNGKYVAAEAPYSGHDCHNTCYYYKRMYPVSEGYVVREL